MFFGLLVALLLSLGGLAAAMPTTVLLVRHAEKVDDGTKDPVLSDAGQARAIALAEVAREHGVTHVFTSQYQRTILTGAPAAEVCGARATVMDASKADDLLAAVRALPAEAVVLIVGHSNTVPPLAEKLGAVSVAPMTEAEYDRLLVLTTTVDGAVTVVVSRYGEGS
ncbi:SixA phosphatase family protein [Actomonas aquatica]|uniref:Phosphoglycerate mutase family protein n=1 Tax=Actomonas aquatica TaxID=2866162 RepID=A0ABZ1C543_9BACT|nr:phosphoglycerate mutase family protein [Opitutus sp. WL0086]WRQ86848.1 phosphoglycerate mutase family protein [Opitutus sp. WL0086]